MRTRIFAYGYWCVTLVVLAVCARLANASSSTESISLATGLPVTYFLPKYSAEDRLTYVPLSGQCRGNEEMVVTQVLNEISYDVDLFTTTTSSNNVQIVCRPNRSVSARRTVLEIACKDPAHVVCLSKVRHRSSDKWFLLCRPPR